MKSMWHCYCVSKAVPHGLKANGTYIELHKLKAILHMLHVGTNCVPQGSGFYH